MKMAVRPAEQDRLDGLAQGIERRDRRLGDGGDGVVVEGDPAEGSDPLQAMLQRLKAPHRRRDNASLDP